MPDEPEVPFAVPPDEPLEEVLEPLEPFEPFEEVSEVPFVEPVEELSAPDFDVPFVAAAPAVAGSEEPEDRPSVRLSVR